jgi:hypothetical protein
MQQLRVGDREEGVRGRGVVLAVGVREEKPGAGTTVDLVRSPDACRRRLDGLRCVYPTRTGHSSARRLSTLSSFIFILYTSCS